MEMYANTVIHGGGPAGMSCGITFQRYGIKNCVLDKSFFPRSKTCAGLVTDKTFRLIREIFQNDNEVVNALFCNTVSEISLYYRMDQLAHTPVRTPFRLTDRFYFDNALVEKYRQLGGLLLEGQKHCEIDYDRRMITLTGGDIIRYQYLVFADGALSRAHRDFKLKRKHMGFCVETFFSGDTMENTGLEIHFGFLPSGYLWVFPYGDRFGAGLACNHQKGIPYKEILADFLRDRGLDSFGLIFHGAFVPYGIVMPQNRMPDNVFLIGDAGGFVDPIYGEGLYFALYSGMSAARALLSDTPKRAFRRDMRSAVHIIRNGYKLQRKFFSSLHQGKYIRKVRGKNDFLKYYCDNQVSAYQYPHTVIKLLMDYKKQKKHKK